MTTTVGVYPPLWEGEWGEGDESYKYWGVLLRLFGLLRWLVTDNNHAMPNVFCLIPMGDEWAFVKVVLINMGVSRYWTPTPVVPFARNISTNLPSGIG